MIEFLSGSRARNNLSLSEIVAIPGQLVDFERIPCSESVGVAFSLRIFLCL